MKQAQIYAGRQQLVLETFHGNCRVASMPVRSGYGCMVEERIPLCCTSYYYSRSVPELKHHFSVTQGYIN